MNVLKEEAGAVQIPIVLSAEEWTQILIRDAHGQGLPIETFKMIADTVEAAIKDAFPDSGFLNLPKLS